MAQFDESKVISPLHPEKAEIGKKYWGSDSLLELKKRVEENIKEYIGELDRIDYVTLYPYEIKNINRWQFLYPYEDTSYQGMTNLQLAEWLAKGNEQLTKAKELIKEMLSILPKENIEGIYEITEEAEEFIREVEE